jgi:hypothetical protein
MVELQSTLSYLKDPPKGYANEGVDIIGGLNDIGKKVTDGDYDNEYDFENDIADLLNRAHDGHLSFNGMTYSGVFVWRRNTNIALISASKDGSGMPKIWALSDFNVTSRSYDPSPVTQINGKDAVEFLGTEASLGAYHDPDARYNSMFYLQAAESYGSFVNPRNYPGPTTSITYENGTTAEYLNLATVVQADAWEDISSPDSFYDVYVVPQNSSLLGASASKVKKRDPKAPPLQLEHLRDMEIAGYTSVHGGSVPSTYPKPLVAHSGEQVPLAGYFIDTSAGKVGVLVVGTFNADIGQGSREFQAVIQEYIETAKSRGVEKHIIDVRNNPGGILLSGYDMYKQFFPSQEPQGQSRFRGSEASELLGSSLSSYDRLTALNAALFVSPFSNDAWITPDGNDIPDWAAMYPPDEFHGDKFTRLLKNNLSDPLQTSSEDFGLGLTITGYGSRSNFTTDPFRAEDLVILSDGICASTCALFTELMVQQSSVRTLAVGGRPSPGPMQPVGGTKGSLLLPVESLQGFALFAAASLGLTKAQISDWAAVIPNAFGTAVYDAGVNFMDNIRAGREDAGIPTQFSNDSASCRVWYTTDMLVNVGKLWEATAEVAFGNDGKLDEGRCIAGSVATRDMQTGGGEGNPDASGTGAGKPKESDDAAWAVGRGGEAWRAVGACAFVVMLSMGIGAGMVW